MIAPAKVFLSYAHRDDGLARRLKQDLAREGYEVWIDTNRIPGGAVWTTEIEGAIDQSDAVLALMSEASYRSPICRAEQLRALRKEKRVIPLRVEKDTDIPLYLEAEHYRDLSDALSYSTTFSKLLEDIRGSECVAVSQQYRTTPVAYITAPPRVMNEIPRPDALKALRDTVMSDTLGQPVALTALAGMGGVGKTVLAQALVRDEVVQQAFPDGIVWITMGKESAHNVLLILKEMAKALRDDPRLYENELAATNRYRTWLVKRAVLLVVDDVWSKQDLQPFLAESPRSRLLFTTRDAAIARFTGAREHTAELPDLDQSRQLLASWTMPAESPLPAIADEMIAECGRLPLAIAVMGGLLRGAAPEEWQDQLMLLRNADLEEIRSQLPEGQESFFRAIEVSVNALAPEMRERYKALSVLLEDMPAAPPVLQTLWNVSGSQARRIAKFFVDRSLSQRDGESIRLHDLQHDYVRAQYPDRDALDLIHGAVRLASHVIARDPSQFASQIVGRLLPHREVAAIREFTSQIEAGAPGPWLRPLWPALHPPGTALIRTLEGHSGSVDGVAVTPDGKRVVSTSDKTLKVWELNTGQVLGTLNTQANAVYCVAVTPDGKRVVCGSGGGNDPIRVLDLTSGKLLRTLPGHGGMTKAVAVTPDGKRAVSAAADKTLKVWDLETGQLLHTLEAHSGHPYGVAVTADGNHAVSASWDKTLKVWDLDSGLALRTLQGHSDRVLGVAVTQDGKRAVSASKDKTLKIWDLNSGQSLRTLTGHSDAVNSVAITPDGKRAVSASDDHTLKVWDLDAGLMRTFEGHSDSVRGVAVTPNGNRAVSASSDKTLKVWDLNTVRVPPKAQSHALSVYAVAASLNSLRAVSASRDKTLKVWDLNTGQVLRTLEGHSAPVFDVTLTSDSNRAISASGDKTLKLWDLNTGEVLRTLESHDGRAFRVLLTQDGRRAVSSSSRDTLTVWDLDSGLPLRRLSHPETEFALAVKDGADCVICSRGNDTLNVWTLDSGLLLRTINLREVGTGFRCAFPGRVSLIAATPDGNRAFCAYHDVQQMVSLIVCELESTGEVRVRQDNAFGVRSIAVTTDGKIGVSTSEDKTLKVWDLETGLAIARFQCDAYPTCCAFAGDQNIIAGDQGGWLHFLKDRKAGRVTHSS